MTDTAQRLVHEIDRDASGRVQLPEDIANEATRDRYVVSSLIEEAFRSSQLEGAATTRAAAKEMIRTDRQPRTTGERMVLNNFRAMEWVNERRSEAFSPGLVLELHEIVTHDTVVPGAAGRLRREDEPIGVYDARGGELVHRPPPASQLADRLEAMCALANQSDADEPFMHPVVRAVLLHFWLAYDHPFVDGNGRTARALFYWSMLRQEYWLTEFVSISRAIRHARTQYDLAFLYSESDGNDATYFLLNQLKMVRAAVAELFAYLEHKASQLRQVEQTLRLQGELNHRQLALVGHALRHGDFEYTIEGHQRSHRVVYQTARTDLLNLVERGYLTQSKRGRKLVFQPSRRLARRRRP